MNIYTPISITEKIEFAFRPTRLYIKELNGLKYFGKTCVKNIEKYHGSGVFWRRHIKKHGKKNIKTLWISDWFTCPHHIQEFALMFSEYNQIVESKEWANLIPENGIHGSTKGHMAGIAKPKTESHRQAISNTLTGITLAERHGKERADEIRESMSTRSKGRKRTPESIAASTSYHKGRKRSQTVIDNLIECRKYYKLYTCEHCKGVFNPGNYHRWHGKFCHDNPNKTCRPKSNRPAHHISNRSVQVEINGVSYMTLTEAYTTLGLPENLLRRMLNNGQTENLKYNITSLRKINDGS